MNIIKMQKTTFIFFISIANLCYSQVNISGGFGSVISDIKGTPISSNSNSDVSGSPFFISTWCDADIVLASGAVLNRIPIKLNLSTHEVHVLKDEKEKMEIVANPGSIKSIAIKSLTENDINSYTFRIGFPPIDRMSANTFYLVLADGRAKLLKLISKKIVEEKPFNSSVAERKFVENEGLYLFYGGVMIRVKKNKDFFVTTFGEQKDQIEKFVTENKLKCKTEKEMIRVIDYFNELD
jgi:hypothetical protein